MNFLKTISVFLLAIFAGHAQEFQNWQFSEKKVEVPEKWKNYDAVILEKNVKVELVNQKDSTIEYVLVHEKVKVNTDLGIENFNKVYLPFNDPKSLLVNKFRVITNGKVTELKKSDIKEEKDQEKGYTYYYFAVNGLQKGSIIEKYYIFERRPKLDGIFFKAQSELPIVNYSFEAIHPIHLKYAFKSYNGFPDLKYNDEKNNKISFGTVVSNLDEIPEDERYSNIIKNVKGFRYKLEENKYNGNKNIYNFTNVANNIFEFANKDYDKKDIKDFDKFISSIAKKTTTFDQIREIEHQIKKQLKFNNYSEYVDLNQAFSSGFISQSFLVKLYNQTFKVFNIPTEIIFTSSRSENLFDPEFQTLDVLEDIVFYFPTENKYLDPQAIEYRFPLINNQYYNNYGLFIRSKEFGGVKMAVSEVKRIEFVKGETFNKMKISLDFTKNTFEPTFKSNISFGGYHAAEAQVLIDFVDKDTWNEILQSLGKGYAFESNDFDVKYENAGLENTGIKPFNVEIVGNASNLIQKAGNNIILKVGEMIGRQMEFYQQKERKLPIELDYPTDYDRVITITLPKNYKVKNPEALNFNKILKDDKGNLIADFVTTYEIKGNELLIKNKEFYYFNDLPISKYQEYRDVVNAAADFNKVSLILEKI